MQKEKRVSVMKAVLAGVAAFLLCSCSDYVGKEKSHPLFVKAGTSKNAGNFQDAAKCYEEFLLICPRSVLTHKELADLYNDSLNEPLKAVYHYEKWLSLLPENAPESSEIRSFAENARKNLYKKLSVLYKDDPALSPNSDEVKRLNERLTAYVEHTRRITERNRLLVSIIEKLNAERRQINATRLQQTKSISPRTPEKRKESGVTPAVRRNRDADRQKNMEKKSVSRKTGSVTTYTVQKGDTLSKISRKFYGSPNYVRLILSANSGKIGRNMNIRLGQVLVIPPASGKGK